MSDVLLLSDERMLDHVAHEQHVERPARLAAVLDALHGTPIGGVRWAKPTPVDPERLAAVHTPAHLARLDAVAGIHAQLDPDTAVSPGSIPAAHLAAGAAVQAVDAVLGDTDAAFALVRPPGHHAESNRAMGFCLYNNVAIAAEHARRQGIERVLIIDWDVHHGNGTQHHFEDRSDVLFFSTHRYPFYPGTGAAHEVGTGEGRGFTVNAPMFAGMTDGDFAAIFREILVPVAHAYKPQLVLVSAGFDAHIDDPLGDQRVTEEGFAHLCGVAQQIAKAHADDRLVLLMEGGYDLAALSRSTVACTRVLAGSTPPVVGAATEGGNRLVDGLRTIQSQYWEPLRNIGL